MSELQVEGELINFSIPGSVAPWKQETSNTEVREITLFRNCTVNLWNMTSIDVTGSVPTNSQFRFSIMAYICSLLIFMHQTT